ncbi:hypothetical protein PCASD_00919 [Puccinia coronata f. sp. avenae]|uniref:Uncharacterized protein n=1 Tax=Puccinia coronata f. sp. avenae TaxID=200324 RepID=A0A2N5VPN3_9BASI|nr:hypothetical protein PCASD_00919 [Puccinia coronata f. sp. avenae]
MTSSLRLPPLRIFPSHKTNKSAINTTASNKSDSSDVFDPELTKRAADQLSQAMPRISLPKKLLELRAARSSKTIFHTFVLAGTGFGKTRIAEIYLRLFKPYQKPVIVVLNPLDALGDNQVEEKSAIGVRNIKIPAINLTKDILTNDVAKQLVHGNFAFVYVLWKTWCSSDGNKWCPIAPLICDLPTYSDSEYT